MCGHASLSLAVCLSPAYQLCLLMLPLCPLIAEMARTRQQLAQQGQAIQEGSWSGADAPAAGAGNDGTIYLESVRAAQRELDAAGSAAAASIRTYAAHGSAGIAPVVAGTGLQAARLGPDFGRLRAATQAALAAAGLSEVADGPGAACGELMFADGSSSDSADSSSDVACLGQQHSAEQQAAEAPEELCKIGSWSSGSGDAASPDAAVEEAALDSRPPRGSSTSSQAGSEATGNSDDEDSSSAAVVSPDDVVVLAEPSTVQDAGLEAAAAVESAGLAANSLYELD